MVECTALEMRHRCKPIGGSNPSLSAITAPIHDKTAAVSRSLLTQNEEKLAEAIHTTLRPRCSSIGAKSRSSCSNVWRCSMQNVPMMMSAVFRIVIPSSLSLR